VNDAVFIKGLTLDGAGTGNNRITLISGGSLIVESCTVRGFGYGIGILSSNSTTVAILDTIVSDNSN
jgi:hypothetical protein